MQRALLGGVLLVFGGCSDFKQGIAAAEAGVEAGPRNTDVIVPDDAAAPRDAGVAALADAADGAVRVTVAQLVTGRSKLGARSPAGFRPWKSGIAVQGNQVFWVEGGTQPGLYAASTSSPCTTDACVQKISALTRPSAFYATPTAMYVADTTVLLRIPYTGGGPATIASATDDIVNLTSDGTSAFWTSGTDQNIRKTDGSGVTNSLIYSNGTPVAIAVAGARVYWVGVDISGQNGAVQVIGTDGKGAAEVSRFSAGFDAMRGHPTFLYYAKDSPGTVHRRTLSSGHEEVVDKEALTVTDFAIDATYAYWVEAGDSPDYLNGRVRRIAHDALVAETLAVSIAHPVAVAVSAGSVYVASAGTRAAAYADGAILRLTLSN